MNHYTHFTLKEREILKHFIDMGKNQTEISSLLGRNKSSISREIKRNSQNGEYIPCEAHKGFIFETSMVSGTDFLSIEI